MLNVLTRSSCAENELLIHLERDDYVRRAG